jgi:hypothetical protein
LGSLKKRGAVALAVDGSPATARPPPRARRVTTADTIARFTALADKHGLVFGELLAQALDAFEARNRAGPSCDG